MTERSISNSVPIDSFAKADKFSATLPADGAPVLYLLGGDGTLRWMSDSLLDFCGIDPMQLLGQPLSSLVRFDENELAQPLNGTLLRTGKMRFVDGAMRSVRVAELVLPYAQFVSAA